METCCWSGLSRLVHPGQTIPWDLHLCRRKYKDTKNTTLVPPVHHIDSDLVSLVGQLCTVSTTETVVPVLGTNCSKETLTCIIIYNIFIYTRLRYPHHENWMVCQTHRLQICHGPNLLETLWLLLCPWRQLCLLEIAG